MLHLLNLTLPSIHLVPRVRCLRLHLSKVPFESEGLSMTRALAIDTPGDPPRGQRPQPRLGAAGPYDLHGPIPHRGALLRALRALHRQRGASDARKVSLEVVLSDWVPVICCCWWLYHNNMRNLYVKHLYRMCHVIGTTYTYFFFPSRCHSDPRPTSPARRVTSSGTAPTARRPVTWALSPTRRR